MQGVMFFLSIFVGVLGMIGIWMVMKATDKIRKNYLLSKYPVLSKGMINNKYTNKKNKTIDKSHIGSGYYIRFSFCATDRRYATYTITKKDHQMVNKYEWINAKAGDFVEVVYCAKDITLFALTSEQKMNRTRWIPIAILIGSISFFIPILIPAFLGENAGTALAIMMAATGGMIMKVQKLTCCDVFWQHCKRKRYVMNASELTTLTNEPELEVPSGSDSESLGYDESGAMIASDQEILMDLDIDDHIRVQ
eukprot:453401_1